MGKLNMEDKKELPKNLRFFVPILEILREFGGSGTPSEVKDALIEKTNLSEDELSVKLKSGVTRIDNQIIWAKVYLSAAGFLDYSNENIWKLTEAGLKLAPTEEVMISAVKKIHIGKKKKDKNSIEEEKEVVEVIQHKEELLNILHAVSPQGFERICQRILRESGFKKVVVKGRSGDGGIDGEGILEVNPLVSLKVIFQSKRYSYKDAVSASQIRHFRGAMQGRAEKGIFITTGRFTQEAKNEAIRDGVPPIELVDGDKLVELFEQRELGLKRKIIYEVDQDFFNEYK
jgi:restriction system protein